MVKEMLVDFYRNKGPVKPLSLNGALNAKSDRHYPLCNKDPTFTEGLWVCMCIGKAQLFFPLCCLFHHQVIPINGSLGQ